MKKLMLMFPGVGSQYPGMGRSFYKGYPVFKETFDQASHILEKDFTALCFDEKNKKELDQLENAQLSILVHSVALFRVFQLEIGAPPDLCMGHSLGEYSALCCAGALEFGDALRLVRARGRTIERVSPGLKGTMMWVINLEREKVAQVCNRFSNPGNEVYISAYDSPTQTSISGHNQIVMQAARELETMGAIVFPLKMNGPFHSTLMQQAALEMKVELEKTNFSNPLFPVMANHNASLYDGKDSIVNNLSRQIVSPICWQDSLTFAYEMGIRTAIEIGPKDVLKFLLKKNSNRIHSFSMDNKDDAKALQEKYVLTTEDYLPLIARCLGAAVSTRNFNQSREDFHKGALIPYRKVAAMYEELKLPGKKVGNEHVGQALEMLEAVLNTKKVPGLEISQWLYDVTGGKVLKPSHPVKPG